MLSAELKSKLLGMEASKILAILKTADDKARRKMKALVSRLLREDHDGNSQNGLDISRDTLYQLCYRCLDLLILCLSGAACLDESRQDHGTTMAASSREADNMEWLLGILTDRKMADEFVNGLTRRS